jgi:ketosteroid isomerase-like protein
MKRLMIVVVIVAASSLHFSISANQKGNDEQAIRQGLNELYAALGRNDVAALDRIYADDYILVNESGELTTKAPRLAAIKSGELKFESVSYDEVDVHLYGNAAVSTYRAMIKAKSKGQDIGGQLRVTSTLVKMKGRWQFVVTQATRITGQ